MDHQQVRLTFGRRLQFLRLERRLTQEQLAEAIGRSTEHVSFMERGERSPSFETIFDLAKALDVATVDFFGSPPTTGESLIEALEVAPPSGPLPAPAHATPAVQEQRLSDLDRLNSAMAGLREMQKLADEYGINDILQDNGGKVLQVLILLGLKISPGREGNDAVDSDGNEYELKTINSALNKNAGVTTHHHLNADILSKYRNVKAWYIAIYSAIELKEIYCIQPSELETTFKKWEAKLDAIKGNDKSLNNPKIPISLVRKATRVYPEK